MDMYDKKKSRWVLEADLFTREEQNFTRNTCVPMAACRNSLQHIRLFSTNSASTTLARSTLCIAYPLAIRWSVSSPLFCIYLTPVQNPTFSMKIALTEFSYPLLPNLILKSESFRIRSFSRACVSLYIHTFIHTYVYLSSYDITDTDTVSH